MFKRRNPRSYSEIATGWVYPRGGWARASRYIAHRLRRLPDPAHKIARGIACGVFVCFTPLYGLHFLLSAGLAWMFRGNILAALLATFFGNPLTFPIIATISVELGTWILGRPTMPLPQIVAAFSYASAELWSNFAAIFTSDTMQWGRLRSFFRTVFWPYLVGGIVPGIAAGVVAYYVSHPFIHAYQRARLARLQRKIARLRAAREQADTAAGAR
jgi:uncharacterized protein (DUF2062 family)